VENYTLLTTHYTLSKKRDAGDFSPAGGLGVPPNFHSPPKYGGLTGGLVILWLVILREKFDRRISSRFFTPFRMTDAN